MQAEQNGSGCQPDGADDKDSDRGECRDAKGLHRKHPASADGNGQQIAQLPSLGLPAMDPGDHADDQREEQRKRNRQRGEDQEQPVAADLADELRTVARPRSAYVDCDADEQRDQSEHGK